MIKAVDKIAAFVKHFLKGQRETDLIKINQGIIISELHKNLQEVDLARYEFKVFSQWGEDGIIQFLTNNIDIEYKTFIEFGVEDFYEANCRFLLMKDIWDGFVIDGSKKNIERLKDSYFYWRYPIKAINAFINRENICDLLEQSGFSKKVGIFSVDIDGVDYYVLEAALTNWQPSIIIVEYNGIFGRTNCVSVPYDPNFQRKTAHYSNIYYGASLAAFCSMLNVRGYGLVGVNSMGSNAFFVRRDLLNDKVRETSVDAIFKSTVFREGRDSSGKLSMISGADRRGVINDMPVYDTLTGAIIQVKELGD
ncbi:hypothetical protein [Rhizobium sp. BK377]|uniref:hypothetical protein n=1 Tax=Rhizobium sp. BK377 TaxID=2587058 RepID=UPI0016182A17|nr:hypothetical protein [Rhizobium sp. BK377]MBB3463073.1 hypothetical protein [Rhizobium sp. BK377]